MSKATEFYEETFHGTPVGARAHLIECYAYAIAVRAVDDHLHGRITLQEQNSAQIMSNVYLDTIRLFHQN